LVTWYVCAMDLLLPALVPKVNPPMMFSAMRCGS
jgi:hypothetical protein